MAVIRWKILLVILFFSLPAAVRADNFVIDAASSVSYNVERPREDLRAFDKPEFVSNNLPGLKGLTRMNDGLYLWDLELSVPLSRPMRGSFLAKREVVNDNLIVYESADKSSPDYMLCETLVTPLTPTKSSIRIAIRLRFTRASGWQFHWLAPLLGQKFLSARVKERLDGMLQEFVNNSKREWETKSE